MGGSLFLYRVSMGEREVKILDKCIPKFMLLSSKKEKCCLLNGHIFKIYFTLFILLKSIYI